MRTVASLPGRWMRAGMRTMAAAGAITLDTTLIGAGTAAGVGTALLRAPAEVAAAAPSPSDLFRMLAGTAREAVGGEPARRWGFGENRTWIEVRGLDGPNGQALGERVLETVRSAPGVQHAELHRPWSRIVVAAAGCGPTPEALCRIVADTENYFSSDGCAGRPLDLPGDEVVLVGHLVAAGIVLAGLGVSLGGRVLRLPRLPERWRPR